MPKLNLSKWFEREADALVRAREEAVDIHGLKNISAAGNQVEYAVRDFLRRMLPPRYYVTNGHLIDQEGQITPQLDVIIADSFNMPSVLKTRDGTEFIPAASTLAIGEIKSTYDHSKKHYEKFCDTLGRINAELSRPLIENTAYDYSAGNQDKLSDDTSLEHMILGSRRRHLNYLFSFLLCIDAGDFHLDKVADLLNSSDPSIVPNMAVFLSGDGSGVVVYARWEEGGLGFHKYPGEVKEGGYDWCFMQGRRHEDGSREGAHLAILYSQLFNHLAGSHLEPPNIYEHISSLLASFSKSSIRWSTAPESI